VRPRRLDLVVLGEVGGEADRRGERVRVLGAQHMPQFVQRPLVHPVRLASFAERPQDDPQVRRGGQAQRIALTETATVPGQCLRCQAPRADRVAGRLQRVGVTHPGGQRMFVVRPEDGVVVVVTVPGQGHRVGEPAGLTQRDRDGPQRQQYLDVLVTEPVTVRRQRARLYPVRLVVPAQTVQVAGQVADRQQGARIVVSMSGTPDLDQFRVDRVRGGEVTGQPQVDREVAARAMSWRGRIRSVARPASPPLRRGRGPPRRTR